MDKLLKNAKNNAEKSALNENYLVLFNSYFFPSVSLDDRFFNC